MQTPMDFDRTAIGGRREHNPEAPARGERERDRLGSDRSSNKWLSSVSARPEKYDFRSERPGGNTDIFQRQCEQGISRLVCDSFLSGFSDPRQKA